LRTFVALLAALAVVLQVAAASFASGAMAAPQLLDVFGNPICLTDGHGGPSGDHHPGMPDCCQFGCASSAAAVPVSSGEAALRRPLAFLHKDAGDGAVVALSAPDHDPGNPRAPPLTA